MAWYYKRLAKQRRGKDVVMRASGASELENFAFYNPKAAIFWQSFVGRFSRYELRNDIFFVLQVLTNLKCTDKTKKMYNIGGTITPSCYEYKCLHVY